MNHESVTSDPQRLAQTLDSLRWESRSAFRAQANEWIRARLGATIEEPWAPWLELCAVEYLFVHTESWPASELLPPLMTAIARATGSAPADTATPFPGDRPEPYWATWTSMNQPPPLSRANVPVSSPRQPRWEHPDYDSAPWDVLYQLLARITHIGDFDMMDLAPIPGVDPFILRENEVALDHAIIEDVRLPMGLAVAILLGRQLAYDFSSEHGCWQDANWIYAALTAGRVDPGVSAPDWAPAEIALGFKALDPDAMLAFYQAAQDKLDRLYAA